MGRTARGGWQGLALLAFAVLAADQATKYLVEKFTAVGSTRILVPGLLNLVHTSNPGVAFGLLADSPAAWLAPDDSFSHSPVAVYRRPRPRPDL